MPTGLIAPGLHWLALGSPNVLDIPHRHYILLGLPPLIWDLSWFVNLRHHCSFYLFQKGYVLFCIVKLCFESSEGGKGQSPWEEQCGYDCEPSYKLLVIFNKSRQIGLNKSDNKNAHVAVEELWVAMHQSGLFWEKNIRKWQCWEGQSEKQKREGNCSHHDIRPQLVLCHG